MAHLLGGVRLAVARDAFDPTSCYAPFPRPHRPERLVPEVSRGRPRVEAGMALVRQSALEDGLEAGLAGRPRAEVRRIPSHFRGAWRRGWFRGEAARRERVSVHDSQGARALLIRAHAG